MASELLSPLARATDADGDPYSGAVWRFYQSGTLTPQAVYADAGLTTSLGSTVMADSGGKFVSIYFDSELAYRGILRNADGSVTLHDIDPINNITLSAISGPNGSNTIGFIQAGTGAVARTSQAKMRETFSVTDFGATGDGVADDTAAIQKTVTALAARGGGTLLFPIGTYLVSSQILFTGCDNVEVMGYGATIKGPTTTRVLNGYFNMNGSSNIVIEGLTFDMMQPTLPVYTQADFGTIYNCAVWCFEYWKNITVQNCTFVNLYTRAISGYLGTTLGTGWGGFRSLYNRFESNVCNQTYMGTPAAQEYQHHTFVTVAGVIEIAHNVYDNAAITNPALGCCSVQTSGYFGQKLSIHDNMSFYAGRDNTGTHRLYDIDFYGDVVNFEVFNNKSFRLMAAFMRLNACAFGSIHHNEAVWNQNASLNELGIEVASTSDFGGQKGCQNIDISHNIFFDPDHRCFAAVGLIAEYDWGFPCRNISVSDNTFLECRRTTLISGPFSNINYTDNQADGSSSLLHVRRGAPTLGVEANSRYDGLLVTGNQHRPTDNSSAGFLIDINLTDGPATTALMGVFKIVGNVIQTGNASAGSGIVFNTVAANLSAARAIILDNHIFNFNSGIQLSAGGRFKVRENTIDNWVAAPILNGGGGAAYDFDGNTWAGGVLRGNFSMTAGSAVVANNEIRTDSSVSRVFITRNTAGSGPGHVRITYNNGVGFTATSSSGTDDSNFSYVIHQ